MPSWRMRLFLELMLYVFACLTVTLGAALEIQIWLFFGWLSFLRDVAMRMTWDVAGLASAVLIWGLFLAFVHWAGRWLYNRETLDGPVRTWPWRWSLGVVAGVTLLFIAGLTFTGIWESILALRGDVYAL